MNLITKLFHKGESGYERWQRQEAEYRARPDYVEYEDYLDIVRNLDNEPLQLYMVTERDVQLMIDCLMRRGYITFGGGWRGTFGESYINMPGGSTPTINQHTDPITFAQKEWALSATRKKLTDMYQNGVIHKIMEQAKAAILEDWKAE